MELTALRDADPGALPDAADTHDRLGADLRATAEDWQNAVLDRTTRAGWHGTAADTCRASLRRTATRLTAAHTELLRIGATLRSGADALRLAQDRLADALAEARAAGLTVSPEGHVSIPSQPGADRHDPDGPGEEPGLGLGQRIASALHDADTADRALADRLHTFARAARDGTALTPHGYDADPLDPVITAPDLLAAALPPAAATPAETAAWWRTLSPTAQQHLTTTRPDLVGNRDGLPAATRDQANRLLLAAYLADYGARTSPSDADRKKLAGFRAIAARLGRTASTPPVLLLGLSAEGQGRGVLSFGDPDRAVNVSAYVPGLGTELRDVGGKDADRAFNVWAAAHTADPTRSTASMVWLGYDPPPGIDKLTPETLAVMGQDRAQAGAKSYDNFLAGLRASHEGPAAHLVALGHSYGSLTVGLAGRSGAGTGADDMILIGSPGSGSQHASQLGVASDRIWVGAADNDPVSYAPNPIEDLKGNFNQRWFGTDPASGDFGAHRFDVADGPANSFSSHSNYLDPSGGNSLYNIGQIVAGHPDKTRAQVPR
ncbi:alpha/beta hydrolase [Kitasatospora sp. NPDC006697]|uniref:alpha/beta hydrolase n=1 Tax=Kitasatospora sp. NPDC006697 TaxID=3364020 RepID=UPI00367BA9E0